jgi:uridylate kinase
VIKDDLRVMDIGAFEMCRLAKLPILVFNYKRDGAIEKAVAGHAIGTVVGA